MRARARRPRAARRAALDRRALVVQPTAVAAPVCRVSLGAQHHVFELDALHVLAAAARHAQEQHFTGGDSEILRRGRGEQALLEKLHDP